MTRIAILRTAEALPDEGAMQAASRLLFGAINGFTRDDRRAWYRFWKRITGMEPGEIANVEMVFPRSGPYHRRHMAMEQSVFDAQDRFQNFKAFRDWLKIGAAHCEWVPGPKGAIVPIPNSISYASMDDEDFRVFHGNMIQFLRGEHAANILWPHLKGDMAAEMMDSILREFDE